MEQIQVITGAERRRRYTDEEKEAIVSESLQPGASVSAVARRHDVTPSLLFKWRKKFLESEASETRGGALAQPPSQFVRVASGHPEPDGCAGEIYIHIRDDLVIELPASIAARRLSELVEALRERPCAR